MAHVHDHNYVFNLRANQKGEILLDRCLHRVFSCSFSFSAKECCRCGACYLRENSFWWCGHHWLQANSWHISIKDYSNQWKYKLFVRMFYLYLKKYVALMILRNYLTHHRVEIINNEQKEILPKMHPSYLERDSWIFLALMRQWEKNCQDLKALLHEWHW